jgi:hypothetical protein
LATAQTCGLLRLTPFRCARRWGPYKTSQSKNRRLGAHFVFYTASANKFAVWYKKQKDVDFSTSFALLV